MSSGRAKEIAGKIRGDAERRRRLAREEEERGQKIKAYAPRVWEELRGIIEAMVEEVNAELEGEVARYTVKKVNYNLLAVSRQEPPTSTLYLDHKLDKQRVEVYTKVPGKQPSEQVSFDFDLDDSGQVRLKSGGRVLETDEAAELMLEAVWIPPEG